MKVQYVSICPTEQALEAGCYSFTPELLASVGARYSRNNEGLDAIASKIDKTNLDKSVDSIFKMVDYGHASIADMTPIALFIDDISLYAAYYLWTLSPTAGGQECSTRYIKIEQSSLKDAEDLGIPDNLIDQFHNYNNLSFELYNKALEYWTNISNDFPELTKIPKKLLNSDSDKDKKQVARMRRNFAFDRARVYLPVTATTGVMMVQSARAWASIAAHLQSHYLKELRTIGAEVASQMCLGAPRLSKHTKATESLSEFIKDEFDLLFSSVNTKTWIAESKDAFNCANVKSYLEVDDLYYDKELIVRACKTRINRYSPFGNIITRTPVKFCWVGISFGEIRDLNRHRTGTKFCPLIPYGFYHSLDQLPHQETVDTIKLTNIAQNFIESSNLAYNMLSDKIAEYVYFSSLGHQYYFEHTTTADKFLYEMELRTGVGAHYKYAEHCQEMLKLWYRYYPMTKGFIFEGSAEPE